MPVKKVRKRYVLFAWQPRGASATNRHEIQDFLGIPRREPVLAQARQVTSLTIFDSEAGLAIVRTTNSLVDKVKAQIEGALKEASMPRFEVVSVSGSIKKLKAKAARIKARC